MGFEYSRGPCLDLVDSAAFLHTPTLLSILALVVRLNMKKGLQKVYRIQNGLSPSAKSAIFCSANASSSCGRSGPNIESQITNTIRVMNGTALNLYYQLPILSG